jgi:hypothetical protein
LPRSVGLATGSSREIKIPFKAGHAGVAALLVKVTTSGATHGVPIRLSIANIAKLSPKIQIAAIGGQIAIAPGPPANPGGPPSSKVTYKILIAIDATGVRAPALRAPIAGAAAEDNAVDMILRYLEVGPFAVISGLVNCRDVIRAPLTFKTIPIANDPRPQGLSVFQRTVKTVCP